MRFPRIDHQLTGIALPVSSLRSRNSCGIGEFTDLETLAPWLSQIGADLLQILPVNDTGSQSSPYSALSAFALHPVYIHLEDLPGSESFLPEIESLRRSLPETRVDYAAVRREKEQLLKRIYNSRPLPVEEKGELDSWIRKNRWIKEYSVYKVLKDDNGERSWLEWTQYRDPKVSTVQNLWKKREEEVFFYTWVQFHLEQQFSRAVTALQEAGVALKGDIPIMMNDDSADVWARRDLFDLDHTAGAPPDGFSPLGQNWGFPVYQWKVMEENGFDWWKKRLRQAAKFYHAYRIDHVLGFFRLWNVPAEDETAALGYFTPCRSISAEQLYENGFSDERLTWLSQPHIFGQGLRENSDDPVEKILDSLLEQLPGEDLYFFRPGADSEKAINAAPLSGRTKEYLKGCHRDRTLLAIRPGQYLPSWSYQDTQGWQSLSDEEKQRLTYLFEKSVRRSRELWEEQGRKLLSFMKAATKMLVCAEDLGAIPPAVPEVLRELGILGLRVVRWTRRYDKPEAPYISIKNYPFLSVCTPSVHDTSTLRQWWEEETDHAGFFSGLEQLEVNTGEYTPETARYVIEAMLHTSSLIYILQIQEILALNPRLRTEDPSDERINLPGTVSEDNWSYRIILPVEDLLQQEDFNQQIADLFAQRAEKKIKPAQLKEHNLR